MLSKKAIRGILTHWEMEQETVGEIYYEGSGRINENDFQVGEEYVLKTSALAGGLKRHIEISQALKESVIHVSEPVPAKDGKLIVQEGEVYCILCRRIKGNRPDSRKLFRRFGKKQDYDYRLLLKGSMTGVTDFELSEYGIRLFGPCYAATGILSENFTDQKECISRWLPLYRKILKGYDDVVHLTEEERKVVPYVVFSIQLICTAYFSGKEKYQNLAEINGRMLMRLIEHKEKLCFDF